MTKIVKVLDKGGEDHTHDKEGKVTGKVAVPGKVMLRHAVDANEIVASDPERFEILADNDETPHDEDILGNAVRAPRGKKAKAPKAPKGKGKAAGDSDDDDQE